MAKKLLTSYTFTPGAANTGTVVVSGTYALEQFLLITNVTDGVTIFQFNKPSKGGTISTGGGNTTLTLEADTSGMSAGDRLQVFVDDGQNPQVTLANASVEISNDIGSPVPVTGPLTDTQLRTSAVSVSAASLPLPGGAATAANQSTANTSLSNIESKLPVLDSGSIPVAPRNITTKFREAFETYAPGTDWTETKATGDLIYVDGNAAAASYLVVSKNPLLADTESRIESILQFSMPVEVAIGLSMSQRTLGQGFSVELVDTDSPVAASADVAISSISQTTTTLTVDTSSPHGLSAGRAIGIRDCSNPVANYPALVVASVPSPTQFTATAGPGGTIPSQTISNPAGDKGFVYFRERLGRAQNGAAFIFENSSATNASLYLRAEAGDVLPSGTIAGNHSVTTATTASTALVSLAYQYAWAPTTEYRIVAQADRVQWSDSAIDTLAAATSRLVRTQVCIDPSKTYKLRVRATNNKSLTVPSAQIVSAVKTGTTTATITTASAHGLATGDPVVVYGIRDQSAASFPNLVTATAVASVVDATTFTIVIGTASTVTSYGGYVAKVQGGNLMSALGAVAQAVQSATLTTLADGTRQLTLVGSANWSGLSIGDLVNTVGVRDATAGLTLEVDGAWKVANISTTTLTLVPPFANSLTLPQDFAVIDCGGAIIRRTDLRISYVRIFDYERQRVEMLSRPANDIGSAAPVAVQNTPSVGIISSQTLATVTTVATVSAITSANLAIPGVIADVASAAITSTATTSAITPTFGTGYIVNIPVTAASGTNRTLDVSIEESDDSGTNWYKVYDFPRISATGIYRSPLIRFTGNRLRYVQTISGTSPSFTRAINRLQCSSNAETVRQLVDRTISLTTLNGTTPSLDARNTGRCVQLVINVGAVTTTPPALQLEGSEDNGASWYSIGAPLTAVASSTVQLTQVDINAALLRARVTTAGVGVTPGYVAIKTQG